VWVSSRHSVLLIVVEHAWGFDEIASDKMWGGCVERWKSHSDTCASSGAFGGQRIAVLGRPEPLSKAALKAVVEAGGGAW
jgi:hypothetical protein